MFAREWASVYRLCQYDAALSAAVLRMSLDMESRPEPIAGNGLVLSWSPKTAGLATLLALGTKPGMVRNTNCAFGGVIVWVGISSQYRTVLHLVTSTATSSYYLNNIIYPVIVPLHEQHGTKFHLHE